MKNEIEISCIKKLKGVIGTILLTCVFTLILIYLSFISVIATIFIISLFIGSVFFIFRIKKGKLYYYNFGGILSPFFKKSAIRISNEYITLKIRETPFFFIFWRDFDIIKINPKIIKWIFWYKAIKHKIQFYSYYSDNSKDLKYITSFELNTKHFSIQKIEEIIKNLHKFSQNLNKNLLFEKH